MRFFKILIFAAIVTALFVGAYWLIVRPTGTGTDGSGQGGLRQMCIERIKVYGDSIGSRGWSDDYLSAARVLISGHRHDLPENEVRQLDNTLQSVFIEKIDTLIRSCYGRDMTSGDLSSLTKLNKAYQGLDKLAAAYPAIRSSQRWVALDRLRKTHKEIYEFGKRSFAPSSRLGIKLQWEGNKPRVSMNTLFDFNSYSASMHRLRDNLAERCGEINELSSSPWTAAALNKNSLTQRLADGRKTYLGREGRTVKSFCNNLMPEIHGHFTGTATLEGCDARDLMRRLEGIYTYLDENGVYVPELRSAKNQIDRIYIKDRNI